MNRREFLMSSACACLATATAKIDPLFAQDALAAPARLSCGTPPPTPAAKIQANRVDHRAARAPHEFPRQTLVPVRFHIIHQGERGYLPDRQLKAQVAMLNTIYAPTGLQFKTIDVELSTRTPHGSATNTSTDAERRDEDRARQGHRALPQYLYLRARRRDCSAMPPSPGGSPKRRSSTASFCTMRASRMPPRPWVQQLGRSISA